MRTTFRIKVFQLNRWRIRWGAFQIVATDFGRLGYRPRLGRGLCPHKPHAAATIWNAPDQMGMSHSNLYKKVKSKSGQSASGFIRFIRLRKAAEMFINTENNVNETAYHTGFNDIKYFRE